MAYPKNADEAEKQGYRFKNPGRCRGCGVSVDWWETPNGKLLPIDDEATFSAHWTNCPERDRFKKDA